MDELWQTGSATERAHMNRDLAFAAYELRCMVWIYCSTLGLKPPAFPELKEKCSVQQSMNDYGARRRSGANHKGKTLREVLWENFE